MRLYSRRQIIHSAYIYCAFVISIGNKPRRRNIPKDEHHCQQCGYKYANKKCHLWLGVSIHWTGLLDWITGLDYWNGLLDSPIRMRNSGFAVRFPSFHSFLSNVRPELSPSTAFSPKLFWRPVSALSGTITTSVRERVYTRTRRAEGQLGANYCRPH